MNKAEAWQAYRKEHVVSSRLHPGLEVIFGAGWDARKVAYFITDGTPAEKRVVELEAELARWKA
jgi:hypothetical protein